MLSTMFQPHEVAPDTIRPLSRKEYDRMVDLGMFEGEPIELLRGMLVTVSPQSWHHMEMIVWLTERFILSVDRSLSVRPQGPYAAGNWSEPEPDLAIVRKDPSLRDHPGSALLLIEVADSSLNKDRGAKLGIYAEAEVPEYWIINLQSMTVEVYTEPAGDRYQHTLVLGDGDVLRPKLVPGVEIPVSELPR
jgi:Uma2 family endonuclease